MFRNNWLSSVKSGVSQFRKLTQDLLTESIHDPEDQGNQGIYDDLSTVVSQVIYDFCDGKPESHINLQKLCNKPVNSIWDLWDKSSMIIFQRYTNIFKIKIITKFPFKILGRLFSPPPYSDQ